MNDSLLRRADQRFWKIAKTLKNDYTTAGPALADLADEHGDHIRAPIFDKGVPEHNVGTDGMPRPGVFFRDEGKHPRQLRGDSHRYESPHRPLATFTHGPETYELFRAASLADPSLPDRLAIRYTVHMGKGGHIRLVAPATVEHIKHIARAVDEEPREGPQFPHNGWEEAARRFEHPMVRDTHDERPVPLARLRLAPGVPTESLGGEPSIKHEIHDESGKQVGAITLRDRGSTLHVDLIHGRLGAEGARTLHDSIGETYPRAQYLVSRRVSGYDPSGRLSVVPIRRRTRLGRVKAGKDGEPIIPQAPAGGMVNGEKLYQPGGQQTPHNPMSIEQVAAALLKHPKWTQHFRAGLSRIVKPAKNAKAKKRFYVRPKAAPTPPPGGWVEPPTPAPVDVSVKGLLGKAPSEGPLTLGELKAIEDAHALPIEHRLSPHVEQIDPEKQGDDHTFTAPTPKIHDFLVGLTKHKLKDTDLGRILADPLVSPETKFVHMVTHVVPALAADYATADHPPGDASWYGGEVSKLDRAIHHQATGGRSDPYWGTMGPDGELVGKANPSANHPGLTMMKAIIAATSGNQKPPDNLRSTLRAWAAGKSLGHPVLNLPDYDYETLEKWVQKVKSLHGVTTPEEEAAIRHPGTSAHEKAAWYVKWVHPFEDQLTDENLGYASTTARVNTKTGRAVWEERNDKRIPAPRGGLSDTADAKNVDVPFTYDGGLRPKGWATYGTQVAQRLHILKALVRYYQDRDPKGSDLEHMRQAAEWLHTEHSREDFDRMTENLRGYKKDYPLMPLAQMTSKKIFTKGFSDEPDAKLPGSFYLGTKFGSFFMNLLSNDPTTRVAYRKYLTADKWWSRNFMRYLGEKSDSPTPQQRRLMKAAIIKLLHDHHATAADLQADLWYHEKNLYGMLGAGKQSAENLSYGDAVNRLLGPGKPLERVKLARVLRQEIPTAERALARARAGKTIPLGQIVDAFAGLPPVRLARKRDRDPRARPQEFRALIAGVLPRIVRIPDPSRILGYRIEIDHTHDTTAHRVLADWLRETTGNPSDPRASVVERHEEHAQPLGWGAVGPWEATWQAPAPFHHPPRPPGVVYATGHARGNGLALTPVAPMAPGSGSTTPERATHAVVSWRVPVPPPPSRKMTRNDYHTFHARFEPNELHDLIDQLPESHRQAWRDHAIQWGLRDTRNQ